MPTYVALLRAVNVGGRYAKMADLRDHLTESGLAEVETYIQTGNVCFRSTMRSAAKVEALVEKLLGERFGFDIPSVIFTPAGLREVYDAAQRLAPPSFAASKGLRRYVTFFKAADVPAGEVAQQMDAWDEPGESATVVGRAVHVWLDKSSMDAVFYKKFKKPLAAGTARDLKVVSALDERWGA